MARRSIARERDPRRKANAAKDADLLAAARRAAAGLVEREEIPNYHGTNTDAAAKIAALEKAVEDNPRSGKAYLELGAALYTDGNIRRAYLVFIDAIEYDSSGVARYNVGMMLRDLGEYNDALKCLRIATELNPNDSDFHVGYGLNLYETGQTVAAINAFKTAVQITPRLKKHKILEMFLAEIFGNFSDAGNSSNAVNDLLSGQSDAPVLAQYDRFVDRSEPSYNEDMRGRDLNALANDLGYTSFAQAKEALERGAPNNVARETMTRAKPRALWENREGADAKLSPPEFIAKHYAAEMAAGTLHRGVIAQEDKPLAVKLASWLRSHSMPEDVDIPTKPEWITREIAKSEQPLRARPEEMRLYEASRRRQVRMRHSYSR